MEQELVLSMKTRKEDDKDEQSTMITKGTLGVPTQVALPVPAQRQEASRQDWARPSLLMKEEPIFGYVSAHLPPLNKGTETPNLA